jgi:RNA polymerase sigma factor (sigma-70 family)
MTDEAKDGPRERAGLFPETAWTLLLEPIRNRTPEAQTALNELCERYRRPLVALAYFKVRNQEDAEDITHDFLYSLLRREDFQRMDRSKGRFRAFLRVSLSNFIHSWRRSDRRAAQVSLDEVGEALLAEDEETTRHFNHEWADEVLKHALAAVKEWYVKRGKPEWYEGLASLLPGANPPGSAAQIATRLNLNANQLRVENHRFRDRVEQAIRKEVGLTVGSPEELEAELNSLKLYLRGPGTSP